MLLLSHCISRNRTIFRNPADDRKADSANRNSGRPSGLIPALCLAVTLSGCGTNNSHSGNSDDDSVRPAGVTVSLGSQSESEDRSQQTTGTAGAAESNVELLLRAIEDLRAHPLPADANESQEMNRQRNQRIVEVATDVIRLSADDQSQRREFDRGVAELLEARLQLALYGDAEDVDRLYEDARALHESDPDSDAAAEGIYTLARFAHEMAKRQGRTDVRWFENFARWSREFAGQFPAHRKRATALLLGAGRSCEIHAFELEAEASRRMLTEARLCFADLTENFSDDDAAGEAAAALRRMSLPGSRLSQFAGPVLDGAFLDADDLLGKVSIIYFWESHNQEFVEKMLPLLKQAAIAGKGSLNFVGVNLDEDIRDVRAFTAKHAPPGRQIVYTKAGQQGWDSPLVRFWGISRCPVVWLVQKDGVVAAVDVTHRDMVNSLKTLF